jgi:hypothetical protein
LSESVIATEVAAARCPDDRRPISSANSLNSSQFSSAANSRNLFATSDNLIAILPCRHFLFIESRQLVARFGDAVNSDFLAGAGKARNARDGHLSCHNSN